MKDTEGSTTGVPFDSQLRSVFTQLGKDYSDAWYTMDMKKIWPIYNKMVSTCVMYGQSNPKLIYNTEGKPINSPHFWPLFYFMYGTMFSTVEKESGQEKLRAFREMWPR